MSASTAIGALQPQDDELTREGQKVGELSPIKTAEQRAASTKNQAIIVNESLFRPSEWDDYPLKRDNKHNNKVVQPDFAPFSNSAEPEHLPEGFEFISLNIAEEPTLKLVTEFLNQNFEGSFHFSPEHVKWVLNTPVDGFPRIADIRSEGGCVLGVTTAIESGNPRIVGLIAARPVVYSVDARVICSLEVIWLCTIAKLRGKRLASVMMKEFYRRAYKWGVDVGMLFFVPRQLPALSTVGPIRMIGRTLDAPKPNKNIGLVRFANRRDTTKLMKIYKKYREHWRLHREYNKNEFEHTFLSRSNVMTYVIRTDRGDVKDFVSLYALQEGYRKIAYVQFISYLSDKLLELFMQNVLFIMSRNKFDAVYISDVNGVGGPLCDTLGFEPVKDASPSFLYQFNYNTLTIPTNESQIAPCL